VYVAPFFNINEIDNTVDGQSEIHKDLQRELKKTDTEFDLQFLLTTNSINPPQSVIDAVQVSRSERADFLLYGKITKTLDTYYAEIKLFDYEKRTVINHFYSVDDHDNYQRMMGDMALKIVNYFEKEFNTAINRLEPKQYEFWAPFDIGYWMFLGDEWPDLLMGVAAVSAGLDFVPNNRLFMMKGKPFYVSTGIIAGYRYGMGNKEEAYEAGYHVITVKGRLRLHASLHPQHSLYTGIGVSYSFDILQAREPYLPVKDRTYDTFGTEAELGYEFKATPRLAITLGNIIEWRFIEPMMLSYSARIGVKWMFFSREVVKKW